MEKSLTSDYRDFELGTDRFRILVKRLELLPLVPQKSGYTTGYFDVFSIIPVLLLETSEYFKITFAPF